jgi:hypothetical protein
MDRRQLRLELLKIASAKAMAPNNAVEAAKTYELYVTEPEAQTTGAKAQASQNKSKKESDNLDSL